MTAPEWLSPLTDTVVLCVEVVLLGTIVLAVIELMKPTVAKAAAPRRTASSEAEGA